MGESTSQRVSEEGDCSIAASQPQARHRRPASPDQFVKDFDGIEPILVKIRAHVLSPPTERPVVAWREWEQLTHDYNHLLDAYRKAFQHLQPVRAAGIRGRGALGASAEEAVQRLQEELKAERAKRADAEDEIRRLQEELKEERAKRADTKQSSSVDKPASDVDDEARKQSVSERAELYYDGRLQELRDEEQHQREQLSEEREWIASSYRAIREDMEDESNRVNRTLIERTKDLQATIDKQVKLLQEATAEAVKGIDDQRTEYYAKMHDWQIQLFRADYSELAYCYSDLSRRVELLGCIELDWSDKVPEELSRSITSQRRGIEILQKRFERALLALGVRAFWVRAGEPFDPSHHVQDDDEYYEGIPTVSACVSVGFERVDRRGNALGEVLLPARVRLAKGTEI